MAERTPDQKRRHADYERHRRRQVAYGRWDPWTDGDLVRAHVRGLIAAGLSAPRIAELASLRAGVVERLLYGGHGKPPSRRIRTRNAERILAVEASLDVLGPEALVDALGTRRRLQALVALGWTRAKLARRLGVHRESIAKYMRRDRVTAATARAVRDLYQQMWDALPPEEDRWERSAAVASRREAARHGWAKPLEWDDIDDPAEKPKRRTKSRVSVDEVAVERALAGEEVRLNYREVAEVVRIGTTRGMSASQLARITGRSDRTVQRRRAA